MTGPGTLHPGGEATAPEELVAVLRGRALPGSGWVARARNGREAAALPLAAAPDGLLELCAPAPGLRLFHALPRPAEGSGLALAWRQDSPAVVQVAVQVMAPGSSGWRSVLAAPMAGGPARLNLAPGLPDGLLALVLEAPAGETLRLGPLLARPVQPPAGLPSRAGAAPNLLRLAATNDAFPALVAADPVAALRAQLEICRQFGLFDRMAALHAALVRLAPGLAWTRTELRALCQCWNALRDHAALAALLAAHPDLAGTDDLACAISGRLALAAGASLEPFARLPSGGVNLALAAAEPARLAPLLVPELLALPSPPPEVSAADALLVANHWCERDEARWLSWFGAFCVGHGLGAPLLQAGEAPAGLRLHFPLAAADRTADHPGISVVMSTFNAAGTVDRAIDSILDQSLQGVELLVCDDGSTDGTLERLRGHVGRPRVRVFRSLANQGTYNIRNALLPMARGRYASFQDSDDYSHPRRLEWQLGLLGRAGGPRVSVTGHVRVRAEGQLVVFANQRPERLAPVTCLAERDAYLASGLFRPVAVGADTEGIERLRETLGAGAVHEDERPLLLALSSAGSLTQQPALAQTADGHVAPARRAFREALVLRRLLGAEVMDNPTMDAVARQAGLYRAPTGVEELGA